MKQVKSELKKCTKTFYHLSDVVEFLKKNGFLKGFQFENFFNDIVIDECDNDSFTTFYLDNSIKNLEDENYDHEKYPELNKKQKNSMIKTFQFLRDYVEESEIEIYVSW